MAKAAKKLTPKPTKKPGKYDTTLKLDMNFEQAIKVLGTPLRKDKK